MSKVTAEEKAIQDRVRKQRFSANGEPTQHPGFEKQHGLRTESHKPSDAAVAEREALLEPGKKGSNLSGPFDSMDAAVKSIKSADSGTRS
jgi:hypothetical protein